MIHALAVCAMLLRDKSPTTIPIEESLIDDTSSRIEEILSTISPVVVASMMMMTPPPVRRTTVPSNYYRLTTVRNHRACGYSSGVIRA